MIWIGIDPGKAGGYAWIWDGAVTVRPWDDEFFVQDMRCLSLTGEKCMACVEKVGARPGQGVTSMFSFGKSAGFIEGALNALYIGYQLVPPATWKREFSLIGKDKAASIETCRHLFPELDLRRTGRCRVASDGKAEALLMAEYARRHFGEGDAV